MSLTKITLAKALKIKNLLIKKINDSKGLIMRHNSYDTRNPPDFDIQQEYINLFGYTEQLAKLKAQITVANAAIADKLYSQAEYRSLIATISSIPTEHGVIEVENHMYGSPARTVTKEAIITEKVIKLATDGLSAKINKLQDEIDAFNALTTIEVPTSFIV